MFSQQRASSRALTRKGLVTRNILLQNAVEVFRDRGYYGASVSEISRRSGMSQGTFYQYFRNKEQIFLELHDQTLERFHQKAGALSGNGAEFRERLSELVELVLGHFRENRFLHHILGEFDLIDSVTIGYYASLARFIRSFFRREAAIGSIRPLDPDLMAYGLLGMASFHALDWKTDRDRYLPPRVVELTVELIQRGISGSKPLAMSTGSSSIPVPELPPVSEEPDEAPTQGQLTRRAIFQAAETVFGDVGLNRASISEITRLAGVAQGTFYIHFKSKRDLMEGFVKYLSHEMRKGLKSATSKFSDRREIEREGMLAFFRFLKSHRRIYRVVSESETLGQDLAMWYYNKLAEGYTAGLAEGIKNKEIRDLPASFMARSLMGFNHMIGLKWMVWDSSPQAVLPQPLMEEAVSLVLEGLCPSSV